MCRNADKLYYPIEESIRSALPLVDEFVVAVGKGDDDDRTLEIVKAIQSEKVKIIESEWDLDAFPRGMVHAQQSDLAKSNCSGDWLIYLQADEVLHENDLPKIRKACEDCFDDRSIEGFVFHYHHFWGDYDHVIDSHAWYKKEVRVVRNLPEIHSWQSAQSFRFIPHFDGKSYRAKHGSRKLKVKAIDAYIFHYGWVRPPHIMTAKMNALDKNHSHATAQYQNDFDYGDMRKIARFKGMHPKAMETRIARLDWNDRLNFSGASLQRKFLFKHERTKYKLISWIENHVFGGRAVFQFKNYRE